MSKSDKKYRRNKQKSFPWIPTGLGLFLIGIALLWSASPESESKTADLSSVIPMKVGFAVPELSLQNISGKTESLTDYRNGVVLVSLPS